MFLTKNQIKQNRWKHLLVIIMNAIISFSLVALPRSKSFGGEIDTETIAVFIGGMAFFAGCWAIYQGWISDLTKWFYILSPVVSVIWIFFPVSVMIIPAFVPQWTVHYDIIILVCEIFIVGLIAFSKYKFFYLPSLLEQLKMEEGKKQITLPCVLIDMKNQTIEPSVIIPNFQKYTFFTLGTLAVSLYPTLKMIFGMDGMVIIAASIGFMMYLYFAMTNLSTKMALGLIFFTLEQKQKFHLKRL